MFVIVYVGLSNYFKLEIQLIKSDSCLILEVGANTREKFKISFFYFRTSHRPSWLRISIAGITSYSLG